MHFRNALVVLAWLVAPALAQDDVPASRPASEPATSPEDDPDALLKAVLAAENEEGRTEALIAFVEDQVGTNAIFAGQYAALSPASDQVVPIVSGWITQPPSSVFRQDEFRRACIGAVRDLVKAEPAESLTKALQEVAGDEFESQSLRDSATFALAQFGDRERVDEMIARAEENAKQPERQFMALQQLADIHYNLRDYDEAASTYKKLIATMEKTGQTPRGAATLYYNCACSLALSGAADDAMAHLAKALEVGAKSGPQLGRALLERDMDIATLRDDERFAKLIAQYFP